MKSILKRLFEHKSLGYQQAKEVLINIGKGVYSEAEMAAFITVYLMRSITVEELTGFKDALLELCIPADLNGYNSIDIVGTGGDGKNTFNISTISCFLVAGAGYSIAKHGNYAASSISGSSNVMEALGYKFSPDTGKLKNEIEKSGFCFLHAPLFHPALKNVATIRRNLGVRTFFNILGPMVNPASPDLQIVGVYNLEMARYYQYLYQQSAKNYMIIHSLDGYDEVSLTADTKVIGPAGEKIYDAVSLGKRNVFPSDLHGGNSISENARLFVKILKGEGSWAQHAVVVANAALAIFAINETESYDDCYSAALESLESGKAYHQFEKLIEMQ